MMPLHSRAKAQERVWDKRFLWIYCYGRRSKSYVAYGMLYDSANQTSFFEEKSVMEAVLYAI